MFHKAEGSWRAPEMRDFRTVPAFDIAPGVHYPEQAISRA